MIRDFSSLRGRVGIFGGSFDPIHEGHLEIARRAMSAERMDCVVFVPNKNNPLKECVRASDAVRLEMLLASVRPFPHFFVSDIELVSNAPSYTYNTLIRIRSELHEDSLLFFIVGSDSLLSLPQWHRAADLPSLANFVTVEREGFSAKDVSSLEGKIPSVFMKMISSRFIAGDPIPISATELREALKSAPPWPAGIPDGALRVLERENPYSEARV